MARNTTLRVIQRRLQGVLPKQPRLKLLIGLFLLTMMVSQVNMYPSNTGKSVIPVATPKPLPKCDGGSTWNLAPIGKIYRPCPKVRYEVLKDASRAGKICMTTLSDSKVESQEYKSKHNCRNYNEVHPMTWKNKQAYADRYGYFLFDESDHVDMSRPPAWSKVKAVRRLFTEENCDWVMWMDSDVLFMNSTIRVESFLPEDPTKDLLVTIDVPNLGYNSGVWVIRNSPWSLQFLDDWWNRREFVRRAGLSKSGDNAAFKNVLKLTPNFYDHVVVPPRCTFNAFAKFFKPEDWDFMIKNLDKEEWYLDENFYHKGDFMVHVPGYDNKEGTIRTLLELAA